MITSAEKVETVMHCNLKTARCRASHSRLLLSGPSTSLYNRY